MVIGAVAVIAICVLVLTLSGPKEGSLEWHKKGYIRATTAPWTHDLANFVREVFGRELSPYRFKEGEREVHRKALMELGFLEEREFVISNRPVNQVRSDFAMGDGICTNWQFVEVRKRGTNRLVVVAARSDMRLVAQAIGKADVPQSGK